MTVSQVPLSGSSPIQQRTERLAAAYLQQRALELVALAGLGRARVSGGHSHSFFLGACADYDPVTAAMQAR